MNIRDWLYVEDHAKALLKIIKLNKVNEAYIIGGNNEFDYYARARLIHKVKLKSKVSIFYQLMSREMNLTF